MSLALWCVLVAAVMPYLWTSLAKWGEGGKLGPRENHHPRAWLETLEGRQQRANWAQLNAFEAFPAFAAAVIIAEMLGGAQLAVNMLAVAFIGFRLAHGYFYIQDKANPRSAVWFGGALCVVGLFITAAI